jgi:hypothetical protein
MKMLPWSCSLFLLGFIHYALSKCPCARDYTQHFPTIVLGLHTKPAKWHHLSPLQVKTQAPKIIAPKFTGLSMASLPLSDSKSVFLTACNNLSLHPPASSHPTPDRPCHKTGSPRPLQGPKQTSIRQTLAQLQSSVCLQRWMSYN